MVPDPVHSDPHDHEEHTRRKRKRRTKKRHGKTNEEENEEAKSPVAHDSYPGLSSTQDLLGEPGRMPIILILACLIEATFCRLSLLPVAVLRDA